MLVKTVLKAKRIMVMVVEFHFVRQTSIILALLREFGPFFPEIGLSLLVINFDFLVFLLLFLKEGPFFSFLDY